MMELEIGRVLHYYNHLNVAVLALNDSLKLDDKIHILGHTTDLIERVASMEMNHLPISWVKPGDDVAIKVNEPVREYDVIYRVGEESMESSYA